MTQKPSTIDNLKAEAKALGIPTKTNDAARLKKLIAKKRKVKDAAASGQNLTPEQMFERTQEFLDDLMIGVSEVKSGAPGMPLGAVVVFQTAQGIQPMFTKHTPITVVDDLLAMANNAVKRETSAMQAKQVVEQATRPKEEPSGDKTPPGATPPTAPTAAKAAKKAKPEDKDVA